MKHKTTKVWEVNGHRLVIADTLQEAASIFEEEYGVLTAEKVSLVSSSSRQDYALTRELDEHEPA